MPPQELPNLTDYQVVELWAHARDDTGRLKAPSTRMPGRRRKPSLAGDMVALAVAAKQFGLSEEEVRKARIATLDRWNVAEEERARWL